MTPVSRSSRRIAISKARPNALNAPFADVVGVCPRHLAANGAIIAHVDGDGAEKFHDQLGIESTDFGAGDMEVGFQVASAGEVKGAENQGFVHGNDGVAVAGDAGFVADGLFQGRAEGDADIFNGVVVVDVEIAFGGDADTEQAVAGDLGEHVVEEADAGGRFRIGRRRPRSRVRRIWVSVVRRSMVAVRGRGVLSIEFCMIN